MITSQLFVNLLTITLTGYMYMLAGLTRVVKVKTKGLPKKLLGLYYQVHS